MKEKVGEQGNRQFTSPRPAADGPNDCGLGHTHTHLTQKIPETVIYPDCLLFSIMPAWAVRSMPETKRSAPWESKPHTHCHSLTYTHPLSLCLSDTLELPKTDLDISFCITDACGFEHKLYFNTIAKSCFIGRLFDRFTQCLLNHVFDKFRREVMNRHTYQM